MIKVYALISDNGDGSASIHWFKNGELVDKLLDDDPEYWYLNEGSPAETLLFPDGTDVESFGFVFSDDEYLKNTNNT